MNILARLSFWIFWPNACIDGWIYKIHRVDGTHKFKCFVFTLLSEEIGTATAIYWSLFNMHILFIFIFILFDEGFINLILP